MHNCQTQILKEYFVIKIPNDNTVDKELKGVYKIKLQIIER